MRRWKGTAIAACLVLVAQLTAIPSLKPALRVYADNAPNQTYDCVTNLPAGSPWPGKRYDSYPSPQPGLQCYTNESEAFHYANLPFFWCVTDGSDGWQITAYNYPQRGQTCYWTTDEALKSLPSSVNEIVPPDGFVDANGCRIGGNAADPRQWGHYYFVRCTNPDKWGHSQVEGAVSYHVVNGIPTVSDGPAPITDVSTWTEPGTPPSWTPADAGAATTAPTATSAPATSLTPATGQTTIASPAPSTGTPSLLTAEQVISDGYNRLAQPNAHLISLRYNAAKQLWVMKFAGACPRTARSCNAQMGSYIEESATDGKVVAFHSIRFYKSIPPTKGTISVVQAIKAARAALPASSGQAEPRVSSAVLQRLSSGPRRGHVAWVLTFTGANGEQSTSTRIVLNAKDGTVMATT